MSNKKTKHFFQEEIPYSVECDWRTLAFKYSKRTIRLATVFSGIGAVEQALKRLKLSHKIIFACDNDKFVKQSYLANYEIEQDDWYDDITTLDAKKYEGCVDLLVGGSPCQAFSAVGKRLGFDDTRGTLFYEFARMIKEVQPKVFIYENVKGLKSHDKGKTWQVVQNVFQDLGYNYHWSILNSRDYNIPQNRDRIFVVGFKEQTSFQFPNNVLLERTMQDFLEDAINSEFYIPEQNIKFVTRTKDKIQYLKQSELLIKFDEFIFPVKGVSHEYCLSEKGVWFVTKPKNRQKQFTQINGKVALCQKANQQFNWHGDFVFELRDVPKFDEFIFNVHQVEDKYYLSESVARFVQASGSKNFKVSTETDLPVARPLLQSMHKMHRAGVDNYVTHSGSIRKLTPRECLRLMGFPDDFKQVVSNTQMYRQTGNSIVVDVLIALLKKMDITQHAEPDKMEVVEDLAKILFFMNQTSLGGNPFGILFN